MGAAPSRVAPPPPRPPANAKGAAGAPPQPPAGQTADNVPLLDIFSFIDVNNSNTIEPDELTACLLVEGTGCTYAQIREVFEALDIDSDGTIERKEFERVQGMFPELLELAMMRVEMHKAERAKWPLLYRLRGARGECFQVSPLFLALSF